MGHINKQRIKDGFLTDEEEMAYQRTLIFETITAIKNIFVEQSIGAYILEDFDEQ